ncbi:spore coat protein [Shouchella miscanthi]|uniref:spore coat protein n=1 Tax=Shouchella miscanthi TaxID=2598861 RepID=UPI0011A83495|nr:spore coat protein [Shouchella miscanthi]
MFHKRPNHCCPPRPMCDPCGGNHKPNMTMPTCSQELPAVVHPTQHNVVESTQEYIVPEIHPSHTTHVKNHVYKHIHHYPHTDSVQENVMNEQYCEKPMMNNMPSNVSPANMKPNNMAPMNNVAPTNNMKPGNNVKPASNVKPTNTAPTNMKPSNVSPYSGFKK